MVSVVQSGIATSLSEQFARLPIELLLEIASHLDDQSADDSINHDEPRSWHTSAYLLALMSTSRQLRKIARPVYWSEVHIDSKARWKKFSSLLRGNRFKKSPPVLDAGLIETLDITLVPPSDDSGGLDANDLAQMQGLSNVKHIRVRVNKGVRLLAPCGTEPYFRHLGRLGRPLKTDDPLSGVLKLSLYSPIPQPLNHCFWLASTFPNIRHLILDNILSLQGPVPPLSLPNLASFKLRNPVNIKIDARNGFSFLADLPKLENLALRGCDFDVKFLQHVLQSLRKTLKTLELATKPLESCPDRCELLEAQQRGARSLETGWHVPIQVLGDPARVGDIAALICSEVTTLALGGPLSISPKLLQILSQHCRKPLRVLALHDVGPLRPTRPDDHPEAAMEKELIQQNSSGISPQDVLHAFKDGFHIPRLELRGMGHEWQEPTAQVVKEECIRRGISLIS